jgi:hypothetical protein
MKAVRHLLALVALALAATTASAQFVKGNEAVKVMPDGTKKVETPPLPSHWLLAKPCPAATPGCSRWRLEDGRETDGFASSAPRSTRDPPHAGHQPTAREAISRVGRQDSDRSGAVPVPDDLGKCVRHELAHPAVQQCSERTCAMFTWVGSAVRRVSEHLRARRGVIADDRDCSDRADLHDDLGDALRVGRAAQRGFGDAADLHVEGLQDRPGLAFALQSGFYISNVADTPTRLAMGVATTFLPAVSTR